MYRIMYTVGESQHCRQGIHVHISFIPTKPDHIPAFRLASPTSAPSRSSACVGNPPTAGPGTVSPTSLEHPTSPRGISKMFPRSEPSISISRPLHRKSLHQHKPAPHHALRPILGLKYGRFRPAAIRTCSQRHIHADGASQIMAISDAAERAIPDRLTLADMAVVRRFRTCVMGRHWARRRITWS